MIRGLIALLAVGAAIFSVAYVGMRLFREGFGVTNGAYDRNEQIRRVSLGTDVAAAQFIEAELQSQGVRAHLVSLETGAVGLGRGADFFLVYDEADEEVVHSVINEVLDDADQGDPNTAD